MSTEPISKERLEESDEIDSAIGRLLELRRDLATSFLQLHVSTVNTALDALRDYARLREENVELRAALEVVRPHVDMGQARLNGSYCAAKIDEHTFCGRGRQWPGHRSDVKEWPEHEFIDGGALIAALQGPRHD